MQDKDHLRNVTSVGHEVSTQKRGRGRPALPPEERARRREEQQKKYRVRIDARRRASIILQKRHEDEFRAILENELRSNR